MNNDCILSIAEYMTPKQRRQLTPEFAHKCLPESVTVSGFKQLGDFNRWCRLFDTRNLKEVRFVMRDTKLFESLYTDFPGARRADGLVVDDPIGWVPPSVKKVVINCGYEVISKVIIPDTVEEVIIESASTRIQLPDSVRKVHFMSGFDDAVHQWPAALEEVIIEGWCPGNGRIPVPIFNLPDTVRKITLAQDIDVEFDTWPAGLEEFVFKGHEGNLWQYPPEWVEVVYDEPEEEEHPWAEPYENALWAL